MTSDHHVQPANLDADKIVRHEDIASWAGDTKFVLFARDAPEVARAVPRDQLHRLTTIMRGTLAYFRNRATEPMGTWWSGDTPIPISFVELPDTLDVQSLRCLRMCMWEPSGIAPPIDPDPTEEGKRSRVGRHRFWLRELSDFGSQHRFPACMVPNALVPSTSTRHWGCRPVRSSMLLCGRCRQGCASCCTSWGAIECR